MDLFYIFIQCFGSEVTVWWLKFTSNASLEGVDTEKGSGVTQEELGDLMNCSNRNGMKLEYCQVEGCELGLIRDTFVLGWDLATSDGKSCGSQWVTTLFSH